ncbi:MAG: PAS domain S-box protein [Desulfovibrionaceae bacterium]
MTKPHDPPAAPGSREEKALQRIAELERANMLLAAEAEAAEQIADALSMSQERHRLLLESCPDPVADYDQTGAVMYVNPAFETTFGFVRAEVIGMPLDNFVPEEYAAEYEHARAMMHEGKSVRGLETKRLTCHGMDLDIMLGMAPCYDRSGAYTGHIEFLTDITEKKMVEDTLRSTQERYEVLLEVSADAVIVYDYVGGVAYVNPAFEEALGYASADIIGRELDIVPDEDKERDEDATRRVLAGEKVVYESRRTLANSAVLNVLVSKAPYVGAGGQIVGFMEIIRDISDRIRAEEASRRALLAAESANAAKSTFLASMSHEIRTPMNAILGMADLLSESPLTPEQDSYVRIFKNAGESLLHLINDILDLSKVEAGQIHLDAVPFSLNDVMENACELMAAKAHEKNLELLCDIAPELPSSFLGDASRMGQIFLNLIGNAVKFTDAGEIIVRVMPAAKAAPRPDGAIPLHITVSDTGRGIEPDKIESIFDAFVQADRSIPRQFGGTGLGLAICRKLCALMDGSIWAESTPGEGSTFHCRIRLRPDAAAQHTETAPHPALVGKKVLAVAPHPDLLDLLADMLKTMGAEVHAAANTAAGLALLHTAAKQGHPFACAVADAALSAIGESDFSDIAAAQHVSCPTILLMRTDNARPDHSANRPHAPVAQLTKPIKRKELLMALCRIFARDAAPAISPAPVKTAAIPPLTILIAEDTANNRMLLQFFFKGLPWTLLMAENGLQAVEMYQAHPCDIIIMDIQMPVMDGLTATKNIRGWETAHDRAPVPILALTANAMRDDEIACLAAGCTAYLAKPLKKQLLIDAILAHIHKQNAERTKT